MILLALFLGLVGPVVPQLGTSAGAPLHPGITARAVLLDRTESGATFLVLIENTSSRAVDVPEELAQYISPIRQYDGMSSHAVGFPICSDPDDRGVIVLGPGYSYGRREHVGLTPRVRAVSFEVDLGPVLGHRTTPRLALD